MRSKSIHLFCCAVIAYSFVVSGQEAPAQKAKSAVTYPTHLPYQFSNFVWWSDEELRVLLKERIPGLADQIATNAVEEEKMRNALRALLKEKGVIAEIQSFEPSDFALTGERAPGAPVPAIVFDILRPQVLVDHVVTSQVPDNLRASLTENLRRNEGRGFSTRQYWLVKSNAKDEMQQLGYLEGVADVTHDAPRPDGDHYLVNLLVKIDAGPQYRISSITADGGPLLVGRDLSQFFTEKVGDVAGQGPFGRLAGELRAFYWHYGYADVASQGPPILDRKYALVSYHLTVNPGPVYHLRSLVIHNLNDAQESKVRELLDMKPGDIFDRTAINNLYRKISAEPTLAAYSFTFSPSTNRATAEAALTLDFYKVSDKSSVTIK